MEWVGPYTIDNLLDKCLDDNQEWPPDSKGVYVVTRKQWRDKPTKRSIPLYVGSTTGKSARFCTRIGDLIADMFGFYSEDGETGHHSGGEKLWEYCKEQKINPKTLYLSWLKGSKCIRCDELRLYNEFHSELKPSLLNKNSPPECKKHKK